MKKIIFLIFLLPMLLSAQDKVEKWGVFELTLQGPSNGNPFAEVVLEANFTLNGKTVLIKGFYDGDGLYKVRFMPNKEGVWSYKTESNVQELQGKSLGAFSLKNGSKAAVLHLPGRDREIDGEADYFS